MSTCVVIKCDRCSAQATNWQSPSAGEARRAAANEGWKHLRFDTWLEDICPKCAVNLAKPNRDS